MENTVIRNIIFCEAETQKAQLVKFYSTKKVAWLPKSAFKVIDFKINDMTKQEIYKIEIEKWAFNKIKYI
jgi:hypothetical protein